MTPERWRRLETVFHRAVELQEEERAAFLAEACGSDGQLREEAERLIAAHKRKTSFIDPPVLTETVELREGGHESPLGQSLGLIRSSTNWAGGHGRSLSRTQGHT